MKFDMHSTKFRERIQRLARLGTIYSDAGRRAYNALITEINHRFGEQLALATPYWRRCADSLPEDATPVLVIVHGEQRVGELRWEHPGHEDTFRYWDDPYDDGQAWDWYDVTHWMPIPALPAPYTYMPETECAFCGHKTTAPCESVPLRGCEGHTAPMFAIDCKETT